MDKRDHRTDSQKAEAQRTTVPPPEKLHLGDHAALGQVVHYHEFGASFAAIVTSSDEEARTCDLYVLAPGHQMDRRAVRQRSQEGESKVWSWPKKN